MTRCGPTPAPGAPSCACWSGRRDQAPETPPGTGSARAALLRRRPGHFGRARRECAARRRPARAAGAPRLPAGCAALRAPTHGDAHPPARDRGGHPALAAPPGAARASARPDRPARDQFRLAREYVTGTTGLAAAQKNRVEAALEESRPTP